MTGENPERYKSPDVGQFAAELIIITCIKIVACGCYIVEGMAKCVQKLLRPVLCIKTCVSFLPVFLGGKGVVTVYCHTYSFTFHTEI